MIVNHFASLTALAAFIVYQCLVYCYVGRLVKRTYGWRIDLTEGGFEICFMVGFVLYPILGYCLMLATQSAGSVPLGILMLCGAWDLGLRYRSGAGRVGTCPTALSSLVEHYLDFRSSLGGKASLAVIPLLALALLAVRVQWLVQYNHGATIAIGTHIWDDLRTIGNPLSLAAHGYPLRYPYAPDILSTYPVGACVFTAGHIAMFPKLVLPVVLGDTAVAAIFYGLLVYFTVSALARSSIVRGLGFASGIVSVSFNLWRLKPNPKAGWFEFLYGYYQTDRQYTTIAWMPFSGLMWVQNHVLGFAACVFAALLVALCVKKGCSLTRGELFVCGACAVYCALTSMDMAVLGGISCGLMLVLSAWFRGRGEQPFRLHPLYPRAALMCLIGVVAWVTVNYSAITRKIDSPLSEDAAFALVKPLSYNIGLMLSTVGPYCFLALFIWIGSGFRLRYFKSLRFIPLLVALAFCFAFRWNSGWFWRGSLALHLLFAAVLCFQVQALKEEKRPRLLWVAAALWAVILLPGLFQTWMDVKEAYAASPTVPRNVAEAIRWIDHHTALQARVVFYKDNENSLAPDVDLLRTGNRAGKMPFDRMLPLVGYRAYLERMHDLREGIADNDYILYYRDRPEFAAILDAIQARVVYSNPSAEIYKVDGASRALLRNGEGAAAFEAYERKLAEIERINRAARAAGDPLTLSDETLQKHLLAHPSESRLLRARVDKFWEKGEAGKAIRFLEPIVAQPSASAEAHYCLAYSYHLAGIDRKEALAHYTRALELGFSEFWVRYHRGNLYQELGNRVKAREDLLKASSLDPNHPGVKSHLSQLEK
jgi:tetratricopeptide (TPR) repeat protein